MSAQTMPAHSRQIERYTPAFIGLGLNAHFDLDPCAPDCVYPMTPFVGRTYSLQRGENGLELPWHGLVWVNPPWTRGEKTKWIAKLHAHGSGIALVRGNTDGAFLHDYPPDALFLIRGRVKYVLPDGESERPRKGGAVGGFEPSLMAGFGKKALRILEDCTLEGTFYRR